MPDHVHMILTPLVDAVHKEIYPLYKIMRSIESFSARKVAAQLRFRAVWQEESFDHVLRSSESLDAKIAYILANPVRQGLANVPEEYRWAWRKPIENPYSPTTAVQL